jgi:protein TonB
LKLPRPALQVGIAISLAVHGGLFALRFQSNATEPRAIQDAPLELVMVNAQTQSRPLRPEVAAQVNLEAGGEHEGARARSPLPVQAEPQTQGDVQDRRRRVAELEIQQQRLLALANDKQPAAVSEALRSAARSPIPGLDSDDLEQRISQLQAQIDKSLSDYSQRPKRLTFGVNAVGVSYARYVDQWISTVERKGTELYPPEARGRLYDSLIVTVEIDRRGRVIDIIFNQRSRHEVLNHAVRRIVEAGAPYAAFTPQMAREGDILQIVRTWNFTGGTLQTSSPDAVPRAGVRQQP